MILALDLSGSIGWTLGPVGQRIAGGTLRISETISFSIEPGRFFNAYGDWLCDVLSGDDRDTKGLVPTNVVMEAPLDLKVMAHKFTPTRDARQQYGLAGLTEYLCDRHRVPCQEAKVTEVRKEILGKSKFDKKNGEIIRALNAMGFADISTHDEADSLVVWLYACEILGKRRAA